MRGLFVTGTDTGVGKTYVSRALIAGWRRQGFKVGVMKPCETGFPFPGEEQKSDAELLLEASGACLTLDEVCPFRFAAPLAPAEAARLEGKRISLEETARRFHDLAQSHDRMLVEGAGGLLVPYTERETAADLVLALGLPLVIVARIGLGTINHTCLTVEAARIRGIEVLGVIFSRNQSLIELPPGPEEALNPEAVARQAGVPILANLPFKPESPCLELNLF